MAANIYDLSTTAGSNTTIDGVDVSGATGKVKDGDNVMRSLAAFNAQWIDDQGGVATTAGTANAQTVTLASGFTAYAAGQIFCVKIGSGLTNTSTTVTINVNSIGTKTVKVNYDGVLANPLPGDIRAGAYATFLYDGTYLVLLDAQQQARYPTGHLHGLTLSNNGSDATNDIDIAVGTARDGADSANIELTSAITKRLDASWAVGTGNGGLDTGSIADTSYHVWLIKRSDTGVVDALFSTSASSPTMPSNYDLKRRIGSIVRTGGAIKGFTQNGDEFLWNVTVQDVAASNSLGTTAVLYTMSVPTGIKVDVITNAAAIDVSSAYNILFTSPDQTDTAPTSTLNTLRAGAGTASWMGRTRIRTNTSGQIRARADISTVDSLIMQTDGYVDTRGRL